MSEAKALRGPYRNGIARRRLIVSKAAEIFATYGYRGGSLRQIALEVGVTPAALNRHFDTKEDLLTGVLEFWREETDNLMDPNATGLSYFLELRSLVCYHVLHRGYLELFLTLGTEASDPNHPAAFFMRERYRRIVAGFSSHLLAAVKAGDTRPMDASEIEQECRSLIAFMDGIELQWLLDSSLDLVGLFNRHIEWVVLDWQHSPPKNSPRFSDKPPTFPNK